jgi:N-acyl-D-amino-acid deacylase
MIGALKMRALPLIERIALCLVPVLCLNFAWPLSSLAQQEEEPEFPSQSEKQSSRLPMFESPLPISGLFQSSLAEIDSTMATYMVEHAVPGGALAITRGGKLVYARGFGYGDIENKEMVQPNSLFRIAGVSKAITQATILQLIQRGHLGLNDKVFQLLKIKPLVETDKEVDARIYDITIGDLLNHRGGWQKEPINCDFTFLQGEVATAYGIKSPPTTEQLISYAMGKKLNHEPGTVSAYSNLGYCLLGRAIEEITRQPYDKYAQVNILGKLGITDMRIASSQVHERAATEVKYYTPDSATATSIMPAEQDQEVPVQYGAWSFAPMDAADGWIASAVDLVRFASAFEYSDEFAAVKGEVMRNQFHPGYLQTGSLPGSTSLMVISRRFPDTCYAVLFNSNSAHASEFNERLMKAIGTITTWPENDHFEQYLIGVH